MRLLFRLAMANLLVRKVRTALAAAAIALGVSLAVAVTSGHATIESAARRILGNYLGSVDARITRQDESQGGVAESLIDELRRDPDVISAIGTIRMSGTLLDRHGRPIEIRAAEFIGLDRPDDRRVDAMEMLAGAWFESAQGHVAVLDQAAAMMVHDPGNLWGDETRGSLQVGDAVVLPGSNGNLELKVVGIVQKPKVLALLQPSVYVPLRTLQQWAAPDAPGRVTSILIDLSPPADPREFARRWQARLAQIDPTLRLKLTSEQRSELDQNLRGLQMASYLASMIALLSGGFIIASALSMGMLERQRTLATMRAIGAEKRQLAGLVVLEALLLCLIGLVLGLPLGILWTWLLGATFADLLMTGVTISTSGVALSVVGAMTAALAAAILPAWGATRTDPLAAMNPLAVPASIRAAMFCAIPGVMLSAIDSILLFADWRGVARLLGSDDPDQLARSISFFGHFSIGLPCLLLGFFLMAPLFVLLVERLLGPIVAQLFGLQFALLRQQLTGGVWRSATTAAGLMLGLAILVVLQVQGNTVIGGWRIPDKFPDMFVTTYKLGGLTRADMEKIRSIPNVNPDEILPIAIASPEFGATIFSLKGATILSDATMFFGVDPKLALNMMELEFRDGNKQQAIDLMTRNRRHVLVTDEFRKLKGLKTGDSLRLKTPKNGEQPYTIAGVVWSPGLDVVVSLFDLGAQFERRTAASLFGTLDDARDDFGVEGIYLFALNLRGDVQKEVLVENMQRTLGAWGLLAGDVRALKYLVQYHFRKLLLMISSIAFAAMAVAALGVANTIMASVRSRRWQFGIMRAIGVTRGQLLRLVLAEAILLGFVGVLLGLSAGGLMAINAKQLLLVLVGYDPAFTIPWNMIGLGIGVVLAIALLAGLWPAVSTARTTPLELLQSGRAAV